MPGTPGYLWTMGKQLFTECFPEGPKEVMTLNRDLLECLGAIYIPQREWPDSLYFKDLFILSKKEANKQRVACFWSANKEDFFFLLSLFFSPSNTSYLWSVEGDVLCVRDTGNLDLICMLTFLLSVNNCATSLAKHFGNWFPERICIW